MDLMKSQALAQRIDEILLNGTWVANTNYYKELANLNWEIAIKEIPSLNSIAVLAQHIHYYIKGINQVLSGGTLDIRDKYSFDFPPMASEADWTQFLTRFWEDCRAFSKNVANLSEDMFEKPFTDEKYGDFERNINGMIEHSYYHLGQIVLIKKIIASQLSLEK